MLAVVGNPLDHGPLDRGRAQRGEHAAHRGTGLEAAVGQQAVKADRDARAGQQIGERHHDQVRPLQGAAPREVCGEPHERERHDHHHKVRNAIDRLVLDGGGGNHRALGDGLASVATNMCIRRHRTVSSIKCHPCTRHRRYSQQPGKPPDVGV